jgi:aminoglycoside 6'-N-acetyltransferase I
VIEKLAAGDTKSWAGLRARLWPDADVDELARECRDFVAGIPMPTIFAVFVARDEGAGLSGFIELSIRPFSDGCDAMPVPYVEAWYVVPEARRTGVGRALMAAAEGWARARGFTELASDTEVDNAGSLRAHEQCGFVELERQIKLRKSLAYHACPKSSRAESR